MPRTPLIVLLWAVLPCLAPPAAAQRPGDSPPPRERGESKPVEARPSNTKQAPIALGTAVDPKLGWLGLDGKPVTFGDLQGKTVVLYFVGRKSAASAAWAKRFARLADLFPQSGLVLVALDANADDLEDASAEGRAALAKWAKDQGFARLGLDPQRTLADRLSVATNGHAVIVDARGRYAFSGTLDDDFKGEQEARALRFVRPALEAVLAGKLPERASTPALGDPILREVKRPVPPPKPAGPPGPPARQ